MSDLLFKIRTGLGKMFLSLALLCLPGCATKERIVYRPVPTPVYQPCKTDVDLSPVFPTDKEPIAAKIDQQMRDLHEDRKLRKAWEAEAIAALKGCAGAAD